ncbi:MAG: isoleucine--tRNA ligase, partial [Cyanobacteria bacterium HKST-UBA03]|nr:isoleucine--tRNA ligase [Cyanobacteria bacterium HKST-UBA03]
FEAIQIKLFWQMYNDGYVYKGLKPVYWDPVYETALAEAEVEYEDVTSECIYVAFKTTPGEAIEHLPDDVQARWDQTRYVIWTTTPWTIPANLGLSMNAAMDYVIIDTTQAGRLIVAQDLLSAIQAQCDLGEVVVAHTLPGTVFENLNGRHPLYDRPSLVMLGDHVTAEAGTGIVHTAPGHGMDDYLIGLQYGLDILSPIDSKGHFTAEAGAFLQGVFYKKGNKVVIDQLEAQGALIGQHQITHSYPHSWRSHKPVIYRATEQWFVNVDKLRSRALEAIENEVTWIPERGKTRISSMVEGRGDWCISRQRAWGVPITVFYHKATGQDYFTEQMRDRLFERFAADTSDVWWKESPEELLGADYEETVDGTTIRPADLTKEMDIMDVWFDSGVTHTAVVDDRKDELVGLPVDLYLEGSDQHRGWFQSSLLTSVMIHGRAPYKQVLTHGFVLDQNGRKMSKSLGNVVAPQAVIEELGADVLRLWVASVDYTNDVKIGKETIKQLTEVYRKIRNTVRFILSNLYDFDATQDLVGNEADLSPLDRYILHQTNEVIITLTQAFNDYQFHKYYQVMQNFCVQDLSNLYFDVVKDCLYADAAKGAKRRAVQTVLFRLLETLPAMLVPVMPHMAEDIWQNIPEQHKPTYGQATPPQSICLAPWPQPNDCWTLDPSQLRDIEQLLAFKKATNNALERPRSEKIIGSSNEARVVLVGGHSPEAEQLGEFGFLSDLLVVSDVGHASGDAEVQPEGIIGEEMTPHGKVVAYQAKGEKCPRCWRYATSVGHHADHPDLCQRCVGVVVP